MNLIDIIMRAREMGASDVHFGAGSPVFFRKDGSLVVAPYEIDDDQKERMILGLLDGGQRAWFDEGNDVDMALATPDGNRQRVNVFRTSGGVCAAIRLLDNEIPSIAELGLPQVVTQLAELPRGLVLVTGPTGSGKSTTLASMVDYVNDNFAKHAITVEDPIEYVYEQKRALIQQREVGRDVKGFAGSLRSALREDPDIILVGEMRDHETIAAALTAAETGHLVLSTLHTTGAALTVDRVVDACPAEAQDQVRVQLANVLAGVITQCLVPMIGGGRCAATEVLVGTDAVRNIVRDDKSFQLSNVMQSGAAVGMHTLNADLVDKVHRGLISEERAKEFSNDRRELVERLDLR